MLKNAPTSAIGGVDTAENEPLKVWEYGVSPPFTLGHGSTGAILAPLRSCRNPVAFVSPLYEFPRREIAFIYCLCVN